MGEYLFDTIFSSVLILPIFATLWECDGSDIFVVRDCTENQKRMKVIVAVWLVTEDTQLFCLGQILKWMEWS